MNIFIIWGILVIAWNFYNSRVIAEKALNPVLSEATGMTHLFFKEDFIFLEEDSILHKEGPAQAQGLPRPRPVSRPGPYMGVRGSDNDRVAHQSAFMSPASTIGSPPPPPSPARADVAFRGRGGRRPATRRAGSHTRHRREPGAAERPDPAYPGRRSAGWRPVAQRSWGGAHGRVRPPPAGFVSGLPICRSRSVLRAALRVSSSSRSINNTPSR